jgi:hydroxymethylglutaryl-CoA reductase
MTVDKARLRRAKLIERVRSAEQRAAAGEAFRAEAVRRKLEQLSERTRSLAQVYALRDKAKDGADLRGAAVLSGHLRLLGNTAARQAGQARQEADSKLFDLAAAERRRLRAQEARRELHRSILEELAKPETVPIRKSGTHLE